MGRWGFLRNLIVFSFVSVAITRTFRERPPVNCDSLGGCTCAILNDEQANCKCPRQESCYVLKGAPRLTITPDPPYEVRAGQGINITCSAVSYPFPRLFWISTDQAVPNVNENPFAYMSEQYLIIKSLYKTERFTCIASNSLGKVQRTIEVRVNGPGTPPILTALRPDRESIFFRWDPPLVVNNPLTRCAVYYTENQHQPFEEWKVDYVNGQAREMSIHGLRPSTEYFIRLQAFDTKGPGVVSNPISVTTRPPAVAPRITILEGMDLWINSGASLDITCNVTADPTAMITWLHGFMKNRVRNISSSETK